MNNKVSSFLARVTALALIASPVCCIELRSQEVYSQIVGAIAIDVPSDSDLVVAFPFKRSASFRGHVVGAPGASTIGIAADSLTANEFNEGSSGAKFYVYVEDGTLKGRRFDIASNTASQITVVGTLTGLNADDTISVREHWTLDEAFPDGVGGVMETEPGLRDVELIVPDKASLGGGLAADRIFYYYAGSESLSLEPGWREVGKALATVVGDAILEPGVAFVVRNNSSEAIRSYFFGEVVSTPLAIPVVSSSTVTVDNFVSLERPLGLTFGELGLSSSSVFTAASSNSSPTDGDRLLVYHTDGAKISNDAIVEYYLFNGGWYKADNTAITANDKIEAGMGLAIRKAAGSDATAYWVNEWSLPQ